MSTPNAPVVNAGNLYLDGLALDFLVIPSVPVSSYVLGKALIMEPGQARDSTNTNDIFLNQALDVSGDPLVLNDFQVGAVINGLQVGANGVDVAVLAASSLYAVYVIASSTSVATSSNQEGGGPSPNPLGPLSVPATPNPYPPAGLLSLASNDAPFLPFGYDMYRRVGSLITDSGALIIAIVGVGDGDDVVYSYSPVRVLTGGAATTFTAVPIAVGTTPDTGILAVEANATQVKLLVSYTSALAANTAQFLPAGVPVAVSGGTVGLVSFGGSVAGLQTGVVTVPVGLISVVPNILYKVDASDTLTLSVLGWQ